MKRYLAILLWDASILVRSWSKWLTIKLAEWGDALYPWER